MPFSKTERELLERMKAGDTRWFFRRYEDVFYGEYDESRSQERKKYNNYKQLKSRIKRKAKKMDEDLKLYKSVLEKNF